MNKEPLTSSRMASKLSCPRQHYWRFEQGLIPTAEREYFKFGRAWHMAMEAYRAGKSYDEALAAAVPEGIELDELQFAIIAGLLAGYYLMYPSSFADIQFHSEVRFDVPIEHSNTFSSQGVIDGLGTMNGKTVLMECKTTSEDISPESDYWLRLRFNTQLYQYVLAARSHGWEIEKVIYDVVRKPAIQPKNIPVLDEQGHKIVLDYDGKRVFKKDGSPRESADTEKGYLVQSRIETPEEFSKRLIEDCRERPEFYFARREVPILEQDLQGFIVQRLIIAKEILQTRYMEKKVEKPEHAWPRNVSKWSCQNCAYASFCLQNISLDLNHPPAGFTVGNPYPELTQ